MIQARNPVSAQERYRNQIRWRQVSVLPQPENSPGGAGYAGMLAGIHQDKLIVAGGANFPDTMPWFGGKKKYYDRIFVLSLRRGKISLVSDEGRLPEPLAYTASCNTARGIFFGGGESGKGLRAECGIVSWNNYTQKTEVHNLPSLPVPLANAMVACYNEQIFIAGGETTGGVSDKLFILNLAAEDKGWKEGPALLQPVSHGRLFALPDAQGVRLILTGGRCKGQNGISLFYSQVTEISFPGGKWQQVQSMPYALAAGTGVLTGNECILLLGGDRGLVFNQVERIIAEIGGEKNQQEKDRLNQEKIRIQSSHPGFSRQILRFCPGEQVWKSAGNLPYDTPVTTEALIWNDYIVIPSGEIRAGVRSPWFLLGKIPPALK